MSVTIRLPSLNGRVAFLQKGIKGAIFRAAESTVEHLLRNWGRGRGGDEAGMKALSSPYKERKAAGNIKVGGQKRGGQPIPNLTLTGDLHRSLAAGIRQPSNTLAIVGFSGGPNIDKARGNYSKRPNMMELSKNFKQKVLKNIYKDLVRTGVIK